MSNLGRIMREVARDNTTTTEGFEPDVTYEPFIKGGTVGFKVTRLKDGKVTYVYMNPSTGSADPCEPDVFIYNGTSGDPANDHAECFICPNFEEN